MQAKHCKNTDLVWAEKILLQLNVLVKQLLQTQILMEWIVPEIISFQLYNKIVTNKFYKNFIVKIHGHFGTYLSIEIVYELIANIHDIKAY